MGTGLPERGIRLTTPREAGSDFRAWGRIDFSSGAPTQESFAAAQVRFCEQVRQELQAALRGRVPLPQVTQSIGNGAGFTRQLDAFSAEVWDATNRETGEQRKIITGYTAEGRVADAGGGRYRTAAEAVKQNWPELEAVIVAAAAKWFQENVDVREADPLARALTASTVPPVSRAPGGAGGTQQAGAGWHNRSQRGILPVDIHHLLERKMAARRKQSANHPPEAAAAGPPIPLEHHHFKTMADFAAWVAREALTSGRNR